MRAAKPVKPSERLHARATIVGTHNTGALRVEQGSSSREPSIWKRKL